MSQYDKKVKNGKYNILECDPYEGYSFMISISIVGFTGSSFIPEILVLAFVFSAQHSLLLRKLTVINIFHLFGVVYASGPRFKWFVR